MTFRGFDSQTPIRPDGLLHDFRAYENRIGLTFRFFSSYSFLPLPVCSNRTTRECNNRVVFAIMFGGTFFLRSGMFWWDMFGRCLERFGGYVLEFVRGI